MILTTLLICSLVSAACDPNKVRNCLANFEIFYGTCRPNDVACQCRAITNEGLGCFSTCPTSAMVAFVDTFENGQCSHLTSTINFSAIYNRNNEYLAQKSILRKHEKREVEYHYIEDAESRGIREKIDNWIQKHKNKFSEAKIAVYGDHKSSNLANTSTSGVFGETAFNTIAKREVPDTSTQTKTRNREREEYKSSLSIVQANLRSIRSSMADESSRLKLMSSTRTTDDENAITTTEKRDHATATISTDAIKKVDTVSKSGGTINPPSILASILLALQLYSST